MVDVVISVLAVSSHAVEIVDGFQVCRQRVHILVGVKVGGVRLFHPLHVGIHHVGGFVD